MDRCFPTYILIITILPSIDRVLWTSRVTSHVALGMVADLISPTRIINAIRLIYQALLSYGYARPAVAGLNPHAGEGGLFGREEIDLIQPTIQCANDQFGIQTVGPLSPDTVFVRAKSGEFDAVVTMYHDQEQIAMKLMGFEQRVTLQSGLPWIVTTPFSRNYLRYRRAGNRQADSVSAGIFTGQKNDWLIVRLSSFNRECFAR